MAFDPRFAVVLIGSSGEGGAKLHRRNFGEAVENLTGSGEYHWMAGNFLKYGAAESTFGSKNAGDMPVDAHELIALCAPRLTFISYGVPEKGDAKWLDQQGSYMAAVAAGRCSACSARRTSARSDDYTKEKMPAVNAVLDGRSRGASMTAATLTVPTGGTSFRGQTSSSTGARRPRRTDGSDARGQSRRVDMRRTLRRELRLLRAWVLASAGGLIVLGASWLTEAQTTRTRFEEIDVERINIVESDGRVRLVLANGERQADATIDGRVLVPGRGRPAWTPSSTSKADQVGGLIYSARMGPNGPIASGSLTFDQINKTKTVALQYVEQNGRRRAGLAVIDRPASRAADRAGRSHGEARRRNQRRRPRRGSGRDRRGRPDEATHVCRQESGRRCGADARGRQRSRAARSQR